MSGPYAIKQGASVFQPTAIPGCQLWLDGSDSSTITFSSGSNVSLWKDKSSKGIIYTSSNSPTLLSNQLNGLSVMNFVGSSSQYFYGDASSTFNQIHTHFIIYANTLNSIGQSLLGSANQFHIIQQGGSQLFQDVTGYSTGNLFQTGGVYRIVTGIVITTLDYSLNPPTGTVRFNGNTLTLVANSAGWNTLAGNPVNIYIGAGNGNYTGTIA